MRVCARPVLRLATTRPAIPIANSPAPGMSGSITPVDQVISWPNGFVIVKNGWTSRIAADATPVTSPNRDRTTRYVPVKNAMPPSAATTK